MIVFGGPPSVGSSLLVRILDRHPDISAGPETAMFARTSLMTDWNRSKQLILGKHVRKLRDHGWHRYRGTTLIDDYYPWDSDSLSQMIATNNSFLSFARELEKCIQHHHNSKYWIEKTPSNAYNFGWLNTNMPATKFIMMIRNPYDTIASMIDRGYSVLYATGAYLLHASAGYMNKNPNIHYVRYEDLIRDTEDTIQLLCKHIGVTFNTEMLAEDEAVIQMKGWLQSETGPIDDKSINRFNSLSPTLQAEIINCVALLEVNNEFKLPNLTWGFNSIAEICDRWDYKFKSSTQTYNKRKHQVELYREAWVRTLSLYPTNVFNFPLRLSI